MLLCIGHEALTVLLSLSSKVSHRKINIFKGWPISIEEHQIVNRFLVSPHTEFIFNDIYNIKIGINISVGEDKRIRLNIIVCLL